MRYAPKPSLADIRVCFRIDIDGRLRWRERPVEQFASEQSCKAWNKRLAGTSAGCPNAEGYVKLRLRLRGQTYHLGGSHIVFALIHGRWPDGYVDHRDLATGHDSETNLREATNSQNQCNRRVQRNNRIGVKGVSLTKGGTYYARITKDGRDHHLGSFATADQAAQAYASAARRLHGEFANF